MAEAVPIPEPPGLPLLGNLGEFSQQPTNDLIRLANTYGMFYYVNLHISICPLNTPTHHNSLVVGADQVE